jgi:hypothetical protein
MDNKILWFWSWPGLKRFLIAKNINKNEEILIQEQITDATQRVISIQYDGKNWDLKVHPQE